jgi:hypothetical protein
MSCTSVEHYLGNLPAEVTSFVGRRREISEARRLLSASRLLTLTGAGGVGKTRLALRVAAGVRRAFAHGVWLVELAGVLDRTLVAHTVVQALEIHDDTGREPLGLLVDFPAGPAGAAGGGQLRASGGRVCRAGRLGAARGRWAADSGHQPGNPSGVR